MWNVEKKWNIPTKFEINRTKSGNPCYLVLFENRTKPGTVLSETVLSGDSLYFVLIDEEFVIHVISHFGGSFCHRKNPAKWLAFLFWLKHSRICVLTRETNLINIYKLLFIFFQIKFAFWQEKNRYRKLIWILYFDR